MRFEKAFIPYGMYWTTPFCRWQGSMAHLNSVTFVAETAMGFLEKKGVDAGAFDGLYLGITIPQKQSFYGAPWVAGLIGATGITGPMISQACATSARVIASAAEAVEVGARAAILGLTTDRTSNGPHLYYPNPMGPGGMGDKEDWVWDNFNTDPFAKNAMIQTGENVAAEAGITREEQDEVTLLRYEQYRKGVESGFMKRTMILPLEVRAGKKTFAMLEGDEGVFPTTKEGLAKLRPVLEGGTITFGSQTHPADGNAGLVVADAAKAKELAVDAGTTVRLLAWGEARAKKGFMAMAVVPAAQQALAHAGIGVSDLAALKTHNPFAVNDVYLSREMDIPVDRVNNNGSSLVFGHPQGPTGMRLVIELIEELAEGGGGYGLFAGCAAGDTAMALVVKVDVA
jgi:acetyl-CoA acetyltransferase family protein